MQNAVKKLAKHMESIAKYIRIHPDDLRHYLLQAGVLGTGLSLAGLILTMFSPYAGEIVTGYMIRAGWWVNIALVALACVCLVAVALWNFGKGVKIETINTGMLLSSGNWQEPDIRPDILVCNRPGESKEQFAARVQDAKEAASDVCIAVVIPFRLPRAFLYSAGSGKDFARETPPFQGDEWPEEHRFDTVPQYFVYETQEQYRAYLDRFAYFWREYSPKIKVGKQDTVAGRNMAFQKIILTGLALLFFCIGLFSQSAAAVQSATAGLPVPEKHADVSYQFEKKTLGRVGNGRSAYADLLRNIPAYRDCCHGSLIAVYKDGELVAKGAAAERVAASSDPIRPRGSVVDPATVEGFNLPDSSSMASMAEQTKYQIDQFGKMAGDGIKPWWDVVMHMLWTLFPFLIIAGAISWFFAGVCAREGMIMLHKRSRHVFAIIAMSVAAIILVNFLLQAIAWGFSPLALSIVAVIETAIAYFVVTWMVPDFRPAIGNEPERRNPYNNIPRIGP